MPACKVSREDPTRNKPAESDTHDLGTCKASCEGPNVYTLSHTRKTGNLRRAALSLTELPPETHTLTGKHRDQSVFSSVVSNSESGQCHARDPTRIKPDELSLTHDLGTCETPYEGPNVIHAESHMQD